MASGRAILTQLQAVAASHERAVGALDHDLAGQRAELAQHHDEQRQLIERFARERLDAIASGEWVGALGQADREATALMQQHAAALAVIEQALQRVRQDQVQAEAVRAGAAEAADHAADAADLAIEAALAPLVDDAAYRELQQRAADASQAAADAAETAAEAGRRAQEAATALRADPLAAYLLDRNFGSADYRANLLSARLDRWVARLCAFGPARVRLALLDGVHSQLEVRAAEAADASEVAGDAVHAVEHAAIAASPAAALIEARERAIEQLADRTAQVDALDAEQARLEQQRGLHVSGADPLSREAMALLADSVRGLAEVALDRAAADTASPRDDAMVRMLGEMRSTIAQQQARVADLASAVEIARNKLGTTREIARTFEAAGYARTQSRFRAGFALESMLENLLCGHLQRDDFWTRLAAQHYIDAPAPTSSALRGAGGLRSGGGFGGGGMRAGRGFGGGGFRSGKGF